MIAFDVLVNGRHICRAGVGDRGVLTAIVHWVKAEGRPQDDEPEMYLRVGGLSNELHTDWTVPPSLSVGDEVTVRVVEVDQVDPPSKVHRNDKQLQEQEERKYYERLKAKYGT